MCGKNFSIYGVYIPRKCIESMRFTHGPVPHSKLQAEFLKISFPQDGRGAENYDLLYQNSIRKHKDDLEHYFIYILYDL